MSQPANQKREMPRQIRKFVNFLLSLIIVFLFSFLFHQKIVLSLSLLSLLITVRVDELQKKLENFPPLSTQQRKRRRRRRHLRFQRADPLMPLFLVVVVACVGRPEMFSGEEGRKDAKWGGGGGKARFAKWALPQPFWLRMAALRSCGLKAHLFKLF